MSRTILSGRSILIGWALIFVLWCGLSYGKGVPDYLLPRPGNVISYVTEEGRRFGWMTFLTASQAVAGWLLGTLLGGFLGAVIFHLSWSRQVLLPPLLALQTTPIIALAPLITFWLGYGWWSKVVVAAVVSMLPVVLAMYSGLGDAKNSHIHMYRLCGVGKVRIFFEVRLQSAWTSVLAAVKVAAVFAVVGSIVADFMGGNSGLGFLIMKSIYSSKGRVLVASVIASALIGQLFVVTLERALRRWEARFGEPVH